MFGRKKGDAPSDASRDKPDPTMRRPIESKPLPRAGSGTSGTPSLNLRKPLPAQPSTASTSRIADIPGMTPPRSEVRSYGVEGKTLVVGREISLAGQIAACDKLVVEGTVEADLDNCRQIDIMPTGHFKGSARIDEAEIAGRFEGDLIVAKRLRVRASARITGGVTYGQIEVEAGAVIVGEMTHVAPEKGKPLTAPQRENSTAEAGE